MAKFLHFQPISQCKTISSTSQTTLRNSLRCVKSSSLEGQSIIVIIIVSSFLYLFGTTPTRGINDIDLRSRLIDATLPVHMQRLHGFEVSFCSNSAQMKADVGRGKQYRINGREASGGYSVALALGSEMQ